MYRTTIRNFFFIVSTYLPLCWTAETGFQAADLKFTPEIFKTKRLCSGHLVPKVPTGDLGTWVPM